MSKRSLLKFLDDGNQRASEHLRSRPDAPLTMVPYAKSTSARRIAVGVVIVIGVIAMFFGILWSLLVLLLAAPALWQLEHHFFLDRTEANQAVEKPSKEM